MSGQRLISRLLDVSGGQRSGVSDFGANPKHLVRAENVEFRPVRAASVRKGSQRSSSATLAYKPHTLMEWVAAAGSAQKYAACEDSPNGRLYRVTGSAYTAQTLPIALSVATWLVWDQLNGAIFATENGGNLHPIFYRATNAADTWLDCILPAPGATLTLTPGATGGSMMAGATSYYSYRLRWLYADGSSIASAPQEVNMGVGNTEVNVTTIPLTPAGRTDWIEWVLERSFNYVGAGNATGEFYYVTRGTGANYLDRLADADLGYLSNDLWYTGIPDGHLDGLIALPDRLAGWKGSTLFVSHPIAHESGAGILNFDATAAYDFGRDDGDNITAVVRQGDRLAVHKQHSTWALEGTDPTNFSVVRLHDVGAAGVRASAAMGGTVWFVGDAGLHRMRGNDAEPFGYIEVGDVLQTLSLAQLARVVVKNHRGQRVVIGATVNAAHNDTVLVADLRFGTWSVWTGWYPVDILMPKVPDFGDSEAFMIADPRDFDPGAGTDYRIWTAFYGNRDERTAAGSGGIDVPVRLRTPWIDDNLPDLEKVFEWIQLYAAGAGVTVTCQIEVDPPGQNSTIPLVLPDTGELWASFTWGDGTVWGSPPTEGYAERAVGPGVRGRRYRITYTANVPSSFVFRGHTLLGIVQPRRRYS